MIKKIASIILSTIMIISTMTSCSRFYQNNVDSAKEEQAKKMLEELEPSIPTDIVFVLGDGTVIIDGEQENIPDMINYPYEAVIEFDRKVYCVGAKLSVGADDEQYGIYYSKAPIYCVDIDTNEKLTLYTHYYHPVKSKVPYVYGELRFVPINRGIALYDGISTILFDVKTNTVNELPAKEYYSFVNSHYSVSGGSNAEPFKVFSNSFCISSATQTRVIDMEQLMNKHDQTRELMGFCIDNGLFIREPSSRDKESIFFSYVYTYGDKVYLNCYPFSYEDLFFQYDFNSDSFKLIYSCAKSLGIKIVPRVS